MRIRQNDGNYKFSAAALLGPQAMRIRQNDGNYKRTAAFFDWWGYENPTK